jgi:sulfur-oxidizing protein SoxX
LAPASQDDIKRPVHHVVQLPVRPLEYGVALHGNQGMQRVQIAAIAASGALIGTVLVLGTAARSQSSAQSSVADGAKLAFDRNKGNCLTCHVIEGGDAPGNVGPPLADMKARLPDRKELFAIIFDETKRNPQTVMPPFGRNLILTNEEINSIIDFLYSR